MRRTLAGFVALSVLVSGALRAQLPDPKITEIRSEQLAENLYVLRGAGGNVAVLTGPDGTLLVDDEMVEMQAKLRAAVALLSPTPPRFVINTHAHTDHTGNNATMTRMGAIVIANEGVRWLFTQMPVDYAKQFSPDPTKRELMPVVTFKESVQLHLNGQDILARHVPNAHSNMDAFVVFRQANVLHTGDLFMTLGYPWLDLRWGGTVDGLIAGLAVVLEHSNEATRIIPGHGPVGTKADVLAYREMLITFRGRIAKLVRQKKTQAQVLDLKPTADFDARYGKGMVSPETLVNWMFVDLSRAAAGTKAPGQ
jgi:cyclase